MAKIYPWLRGRTWSTPRVCQAKKSHDTCTPSIVLSLLHDGTLALEAIFNHFENSKQEDNYSAVAACIVNKCVCRCVSVCVSMAVGGCARYTKMFSVFRILTKLKFTHQFDIYVFCCCRTVC